MANTYYSECCGDTIHDEVIDGWARCSGCKEMSRVWDSDEEHKLYGEYLHRYGI